MTHGRSLISVSGSMMILLLVYILFLGSIGSSHAAATLDALEAETAAPKPLETVSFPESHGSEAVILLHGLARTGRSMRLVETALENAGYVVYTLEYPSRYKSVEEIAHNYLTPLIEKCQIGNYRKIHFVAHSMGNIVLRFYFKRQELDNIGRMVMLAPPNQGSEIVDALGRMQLFSWLHGPAGVQLGTSGECLPRQLPEPPGEYGVIAGTVSINPVLSLLLPGDDDGKVSVKSTMIRGMKDFAEVPVPHALLMFDRQVIQMIISFLKHGSFMQEDYLYLDELIEVIQNKVDEWR